MHPFDRTDNTPPTSTTSRDDESGQAMVEFAMVLPILALVLFGVVQFGMAFWTYQQVSAAASEGARKAAVSRVYGDRETRVSEAVKAASPKLTASQVNVSTSSTWVVGSPVTVNVTYPIKIEILGVTFFDSNLTGTRTAQVEQ